MIAETLQCQSQIRSFVTDRDLTVMLLAEQATTYVALSLIANLSSI